MGTRKPTKGKKYITRDGDSYDVTKMKSVTVGPSGKVTGGITKDGAILVLGERIKPKKKMGPPKPKKKMGPPKPKKRKK